MNPNKYDFKFFEGGMGKLYKVAARQKSQIFMLIKNHTANTCGTIAKLIQLSNDRVSQVLQLLKHMGSIRFMCGQWEVVK